MIGYVYHVLTCTSFSAFSYNPDKAEPDDLAQAAWLHRQNMETLLQTERLGFSAQGRHLSLCRTVNTGNEVASFNITVHTPDDTSSSTVMDLWSF